jgi:hypothetical protein
MSSKVLLCHSKSKSLDQHFDYRKVIGKMNYLENIPDQIYHERYIRQHEHGKAVKWIGRYVKGTKDLGMIYRPKLEKGLEVCVDASFA